MNQHQTDPNLVPLIRFLLAGPARDLAQNPAQNPDPHSMLTLTNADGRQKTVALSDLAAARQAGLIESVSGAYTARPEARIWLKRMLSAGDLAYQKQHGDIIDTAVETAGQSQTLHYNLSESPLGMLARLKDKSGQPFMPEDALMAGNRLHLDFQRAHLQPRITQSYEPRVSGRAKGERGAGADLSDTALAARQRVNRAIAAMGPELAGVALDICCFMKGLEVVEQERQWPVRSAKLMLRTALLALNRHYNPAPPPARRSAHHWGDDGFRPDWALPGGL